jgi:hypothetical protein
VCQIGSETYKSGTLGRDDPLPTFPADDEFPDPGYRSIIMVGSVRSKALSNSIIGE